MKKLAALISLMVLITACKKSKNDPEINQENIAGTYTLTALRMSATGIPEQDALPFMNACEKDDIYILNADNSFKYIDAGIACEPANDFDGNWVLEGKRISFRGDTGTITKFDGKIMEVIVTTTEQATTYNIKSTFEKQAE